MKKDQNRKLRRMGSMDIPFFILVLVLLSFGLVMLFSASYAFAYYNYQDSFHFIKKQAVFAVGGFIAMIFFSFVNYKVYKKYVFVIFIIATILLIVVLFMPPLNGAKRWIIFPGGNFQPSEIMKFAVIVLFSHFIASNYEKMQTFTCGVVPFIAVIALVAVLMLLQPHLSGTVLIVLISLSMMLVGGTKIRYFVIAVGAVGVMVVGIVFVKGIDYVQQRLAGWFNPFLDPRGDTFQTMQSLLSIGSGGVLGLGLGSSRQKYLYLPEPQNDFIFSIVCEELGLIGAIIVISLFALLIYRGFIIASKAPDKFGAMLCIGLTLQIGIQAMLNIAVVSNTIPNTGISLPFFSYGGTALLMQLCQMGIILNISRHSRIQKV
jgi:cell division protein FtsW